MVYNLTMQRTVGIPENMKVVGSFVFRRHPAGTVQKLEALHAAGKHDEANALLEKGEIAVEAKNLVVDSTGYGKDILRNWIISAYPGLFTQLGPGYVEIGTSSTTPTAADTALGASVARAAISYAQNSGGVCTLQFFIVDASLANGTYREAGTFVGGSNTLASGNMFNHALFAAPYTKATGTDTTVQVTFTLT